MPITPPISNESYKGYFVDQAALESAYPVGEDGWYANVGSTDTIWIWDNDTNAWVNSGVIPESYESQVVGAAEKTTPVDADLVGIVDSQDADNIKKLSWSNIKATLKTYFDTIYLAISNLVIGYDAIIDGVGTKPNTYINAGAATLDGKSGSFLFTAIVTETADILFNNSTQFIFGPQSGCNMGDYQIDRVADYSFSCFGTSRFFGYISRTPLSSKPMIINSGGSSVRPVYINNVPINNTGSIANTPIMEADAGSLILIDVPVEVGNADNAGVIISNSGYFRNLILTSAGTNCTNALVYEGSLPSDGLNVSCGGSLQTDEIIVLNNSNATISDIRLTDQFAGRIKTAGYLDNCHAVDDGPNGNTWTVELIGDRPSVSNSNFDNVVVNNTVTAGKIYDSTSENAITNNGTITQASGNNENIGNISYDVDPSTNGGRLTGQSGVPVPTSDLTALTILYFISYTNNLIALYDGTNWRIFTFSEISLAIGTLTDDFPYDVFIYNNAGTLTLELLAWSTLTTRATGLVRQNGVRVKSGDATRRFLGTIRTTSTTTFEDSQQKKYLWNECNRIDTSMYKVTATASTTYGTAAFRAYDNDIDNAISIVYGGEGESIIDVSARCNAAASGAAYAYAAIGYDSTTAGAANSNFGTVNAAEATLRSATATLKMAPDIGGHYFCPLERTNGNTVTFAYNDATVYKNGITALWQY